MLATKWNTKYFTWGENNKISPFWFLHCYSVNNINGSSCCIAVEPAMSDSPRCADRPPTPQKTFRTNTTAIVPSNSHHSHQVPITNWLPQDQNKTHSPWAFPPQLQPLLTTNRRIKHFVGARKQRKTMSQYQSEQLGKKWSTDVGVALQKRHLRGWLVVKNQISIFLIKYTWSLKSGVKCSWSFFSRVAHSKFDCIAGCEQRKNRQTAGG